MFKVVCELTKLCGEEGTRVKLKNCEAYEFSPFQADGKIVENKIRLKNANTYAKDFLEDIDLSINTEIFKDLRLAVETSNGLDDFRFISIIEESSLVKAVGAPEEQPYSMVFDTVIKLNNEPKPFVERFINYFSMNQEIVKSEEKIPKYSVKWELFYPLDIDPNLSKEIRYKVFKETKEYTAQYHQYDPYFMKYLFGSDILNHKKIDVDKNHSDETIQNIYDEYKDNLKEIIAVKFLQLLEKDKRCISEDAKAQTNFVDITPRYLLDSFYKVNYFSKNNFNEMCEESFGGTIVTLTETLNKILSICHSGSNKVKQSSMKEPSELSNELVTVNCETIVDILSSIPDLPALIKEFDYI